MSPLSLAKYIKAYDDYTTNLPLDACNDDDVLLAYNLKWNGQPLTKEQGWLVHTIGPKRNARKSAPWVNEITFSDRDQKGFWEVRGYSNSVLLWQNDRYG